MAKEQKLVLVRVEKTGFVPVVGFSGDIEKIFVSGWEITQMVPVSRHGEGNELVLLLERDAAPRREE